jgi:metallo-beta-lactamase class B
MRRVKKALVSLAAALLVVAALAWFFPPFAEWLYIALFASNRSVPPARIADNVYYVGASDLGSFLITGSQGHLLIDSGAAQTEPQVLANIRAAGFDPADVKIILNSHGHFDHAAGIAALKAATRAKLYASPEERKLIEAGGRGDFQFGDHLAYEPATVDHVLEDGEVVSVGEIALTALFTPGHTKGCTSWAMRVTVQGVPRDLLLICSLSLPWKLKDNEAYPGVVDDFRSTFGRLKGLPCDVFLAPHARMFGFAAKSRSGKRDAFVDPEGCRDFIRRHEQRFEAAAGSR